MQSSRGGEDAKRTQGYVKQTFRNSLVMPVVKCDVMLSILLILSVPLDSSYISLSIKTNMIYLYNLVW